MVDMHEAEVHKPGDLQIFQPRTAISDGGKNTNIQTSPGSFPWYPPLVTIIMVSSVIPFLIQIVMDCFIDHCIPQKLLRGL